MGLRAGPVEQGRRKLVVLATTTPSDLRKLVVCSFQNPQLYSSFPSPSLMSNDGLKGCSAIFYGMRGVYVSFSFWLIFLCGGMQYGEGVASRIEVKCKPHEHPNRKAALLRLDGSRTLSI